MNKVVMVGAKLYGYCGGCFGDSYNDKRVEAIGFDWVVAREIDSGQVVFADNAPSDLTLYLTPESDYRL